MSSDDPHSPDFDHHAHHQRRIAAALSEGDGVLPFHYATCFGCGPASPHGLHLVVRREGKEIRSEITFGREREGAPGIVHGGMVSSACDDFLGFAMYLSPRTSVTRALQVDFVRPALIDVRYDLRGWVEEAHRHKAWFACEATDPDGVVTFTGRALFVNVAGEHFAQGSVTP